MNMILIDPGSCHLITPPREGAFPEWGCLCMPSNMGMPMPNHSATMIWVTVNSSMLNGICHALDLSYGGERWIRGIATPCSTLPYQQQARHAKETSLAKQWCSYQSYGYIYECARGPVYMSQSCVFQTSWKYQSERHQCFCCWKLARTQQKKLLHSRK